MNTDHDARPGSKATGITNKPDALERAEQARVPPRGARKGEAPPPDLVEEDLVEEEEDRPPADVGAFIEELRAERAALLEQLEKRSGLAHSLSADLSEPEDDAGIGAAQRDTDRLEPMLERAARRIDAIQHVLERAVQGRLTRCDSCGRSIGIERLRAVPETTLCVSCARELEQRAQG